MNENQKTIRSSTILRRLAKLKPGSQTLILDDLNIKGDFKNCDLTKLYLSHCTLNEVNFRGVTWPNAVIRDCHMLHCTFKDCNLTHAWLNNGTLHNCLFNNCRLKSANFKYARMAGITGFGGSDLRDAKFDYAAWPLNCQTLHIKGASVNLAAQLLYHTLAVLKTVDDPKCRAVLKLPQVNALANQFHRVKSGELPRL